MSLPGFEQREAGSQRNYANQLRTLAENGQLPDDFFRPLSEGGGRHPIFDGYADGARPDLSGPGFDALPQQPTPGELFGGHSESVSGIGDAATGGIGIKRPGL